MKKATFVKHMEDWRGHAHLYRLSEPMPTYGETPTNYVIVSAIRDLFSGEPETYIFASDDTGDKVDWTELPGSERSIFDHAKALANAGYEVAA